MQHDHLNYQNLKSAQGAIYFYFRDQTISKVARIRNSQKQTLKKPNKWVDLTSFVLFLYIMCINMNIINYCYNVLTIQTFWFYQK